MNGFGALMIGFLELTLVAAAMALMHRMRRTVGSAGFAMLFGTLLVLAQFLSAADIRLRVGAFSSLEITVPVGVMLVMMPCLASMLLVYTNDGALAAQRLIIGMAAALGMFYYLGKLTRLQLDWTPYPLSQVSHSETLKIMLDRMFSSVGGSILSMLAAVFVMPVAYSQMRRFKSPIFVSLFVALLTGMELTMAIYIPFGGFVGWEAGLRELATTSLLIPWVALYLAGVIGVYLAKVEREQDSLSDRPLELVFAFLSGYGRFKELERDLSERENRHRMILQNAGDMILLLDRDGTVKEANRAACSMLRCRDEAELTAGVNFFELAGLTGDFTPPAKGQDVRRKLTVKLPDGDELVLDTAMSEVELQGESTLLLVGRDVTEESRLAAERASLSEQVAHLQRLEALGRLTGGIAHDFNNYIHAILGHLDLLEMKYSAASPDLQSHLHKIGDVAEQAANLTGQLLGFARKGKYQVVEIDLRDLAERAVELFLPNRAQQAELEVKLGDAPLKVNGDKVQLQQVMLNLLLNAFDAVRQNPPDRPPAILVQTGHAANSPIPPEPPRPVGGRSVKINAADYLYVMVRDNGCGMDKDTLEHAFDPFFTTKPVGEGAGMGLPMVYGAITNHYGWVQIKSKLDFGTSVLLFFPKASVTPIPIQAEVRL